MTNPATAPSPSPGSASPAPSSSATAQWARILARWTLFLAALFVVGPIAGLVTGPLRSSSGAPDTTPFLSTTPVMGGLGLVVVFGLALAIGMPAGRALGVGVGLRCAGIVLAWAAWRTGDAGEILRQTDSVGTLRVLALEGFVVWGLLLVAVAALQAGSPQHASRGDQPLGSGPAALLRDLQAMRSIAGLASFAASTLGAGIVAWIIAISPLRGQALAAGILAGLGGAAAGTLAFRALGRETQPTLPLFAGVCLMAVIAPILAMVMHAGPQGVVEAAYANELFAPANLLPLDWAAGAVLGVPIGAAWVRSVTAEPEDR